VLKIGFRTDDDDESPWFLEAPDFFAEGWWAFENRSDVALGMAGSWTLAKMSFRTVHFTPLLRDSSLTLKATHNASNVVCRGSHQGWIHEQDSYNHRVSLGY
jgi:hypothetical protein